MIRTAELYTKYPGDKGTRYYKYVPSNGVAPKGVILFYHGLGEISSTNLSLVERNGLPAFLAVDGVRSGMEIPYIVLAPQEEPPSQWYGRAIDGVKLAQTFKLPIHKCGLSLGSMIDSEILKDLPGCFASVATCCGKINEYSNTLIELSKIPTVHYYDPGDKVIANGYPSVKSMHERLKAVGKDSTMIEYPGVGHGVWNKCYNPNDHNDYIAWLESKFGVITPPIPVTRLNIVKTQVEISTGRIIYIDENGKEY